jgi:hypothetical protein
VGFDGFQELRPGGLDPGSVFESRLPAVVRVHVPRTGTDTKTLTTPGTSVREYDDAETVGDALQALSEASLE